MSARPALRADDAAWKVILRAHGDRALHGRTTGRVTNLDDLGDVADVVV